MIEQKYRSKTLKCAGLTEADVVAIGEVVGVAEKSTNGEIVAAITPASHDYSFSELLFALILGSIVCAVLTIFSGGIFTWAQGLFWLDVPVWFMPGFIGALSFVAIALCFWFANIPAIDRLIVPKAYRSFAVYRRALRHFTESGVYDTKEQSGILIFVSLLEREVRIIADRGICSKIEQSEWDAIASELAAGFAKGSSSKKALIHAIEQCGELLATHFPPLTENPNELHDSLDILEAGE